MTEYNEDGEEIIGDCECGWKFSLNDLFERCKFLYATPQISVGLDGGKEWQEYFKCKECHEEIEYDAGT